jgi:hypothetical protein
MTGHTPWREIKRKSQMQNGSRLSEHRMPRVSPESWILLVMLVAALVFWGERTQAQEYVPYVKDTGTIVEQAELCFAPDLGQPFIKTLVFWQRLVNELESYERGGSPLNEEEAIVAQRLYDSGICATVAEFYMIDVVNDTEGYVLARFNAQYGFTSATFIVAKKDVLLDRGI